MGDRDGGHGLDPVLLRALRRAAAADVLLVASDFDGTLAPIVLVPADARALPAGLAALTRLASLPRTVVAVVSGRSRQDLVDLSGLGDPVLLLGSHGAEPAHGPAPALDAAQQALLVRLLADTATLAGGAPGVQLEPKPGGVAVHVRRASPTDAARVSDLVRTGPGRWAGVHLLEGKEVVELSVVRTSKGAALEELRTDLGADALVFLGDDLTDESVFTRLRGIDVGVKVGPGATAAEFVVAAPEQVVDVLTDLLATRSASPG